MVALSNIISTKPPTPHDHHGPRTVRSVTAECLPRSDGQPDRKVVVTRDCGCTYFWGAPLDSPLPQPGAPAMTCLGPADATFHRPPD